MNEEAVEKIMYIALGVAAVLAGLALLVGAINLGSHIAAFWVVITFQIVLTAVGVIVSAAVAYALAGRIAMSATEKITGQLDHIRKEYSTLIKQIGKRTPAFAATIALAAEAVKMISDKSFEGKAVDAVTISLGLLILFWLANQLIVSEARWRRVCGVVIWFASIASVPIGFMLARQWSFADLIQELSALESGTKVMLGIETSALILLPLFFHGSKEAS